MGIIRIAIYPNEIGRIQLLEMSRLTEARIEAALNNLWCGVAGGQKSSKKEETSASRVKKMLEDTTNAPSLSLTPIVPPRPWNYEDFLNRLHSFHSPVNWFAKKVSPLECCRYGWQNIGIDKLQCATCRAVLVHKGDESQDSQGNNFEEQLHLAHDEHCEWRVEVNKCPDHFLVWPLTNNESFDFLTRLKSILQMMIHSSLGPDKHLTIRLPSAELNRIFSPSSIAVDRLRQLFSDSIPSSPPSSSTHSMKDVPTFVLNFSSTLSKLSANVALKRVNIILATNFLHEDSNEKLSVTTIIDHPMKDTVHESLNSLESFENLYLVTIRSIATFALFGWEGYPIEKKSPNRLHCRFCGRTIDLECFLENSRVLNPSEQHRSFCLWTDVSNTVTTSETARKSSEIFLPGFEVCADALKLMESSVPSSPTFPSPSHPSSSNLSSSSSSSPSSSSSSSPPISVLGLRTSFPLNDSTTEIRFKRIRSLLEAATSN